MLIVFPNNFFLLHCFPVECESSQLWDNFIKIQGFLYCETLSPSVAIYKYSIFLSDEEFVVWSLEFQHYAVNASAPHLWKQAEEHFPVYYI